MNSSTWTKEQVAVNGFNEDMQYGGLDRELGERLWNNGVKSRQIRYSAVCLHLDHARGYADPVVRARNDAIQEVRRNARPGGQRIVTGMTTICATAIQMTACVR